MTWTPPLPPLAILEAPKPVRRPRSSVPISRAMSKGDVRRLAREATETAINTLVEVCSAVIATETLNEQGLPVLVPMHPAAARVSAAMALLERGYGKPVQPVAVGGAGDFDELTDEELQAFILQESILIVRGHDEGSS